MSVNQRVNPEHTLDGRGFPGYPKEPVAVGFADEDGKTRRKHMKRIAEMTPQELVDLIRAGRKFDASAAIGKRLAKMTDAELAALGEPGTWFVKSE